MSTRLKTNVTPLSLPIAVLVIALLTVSAACVARCLGVPCHGVAATASVPPCHKEKPTKAPAEGCQQSVLVAAADPLTLTRAATVHFAVTALSAGEASVPRPATVTRVVGESTAPPGSPVLQLSVVLRV
ncbi:MAG TPA: hypothetical protein VES20_10380 [Bryobacteraceae bacterium]|nr:hypothetical protein [Bryobacteraceae bacterium]